MSYDVDPLSDLRKFRRRAWQHTPVFLPRESHGQRSLWATVHGFTKSQTQLSDETTTTLLSKQSILYCSKL